MRPGISITGAQRPGATATDTPSATATQEQTVNNRNYTAEELSSAWNAFIAANPTRHILINTMQSAQPQPVEGNKHLYTATVQSEYQANVLQEALHEITNSLHNALGNNALRIEVKINQGAPPIHTLNNREFLATLLADIPELQLFIDDFKLKLQ